MGPEGRHPYFDDHSTARLLRWHRQLGAGLAAARAAGKLLFLQVGRVTCGGSRALLEKTIPKDEIVEFLAEHYVCAAADSDALPADVAALLADLPRSEPTPLCVYIDPGAADGPLRVLHSTAGGRPPAVFLRDMTEAVAKGRGK